MRAACTFNMQSIGVDMQASTCGPPCKPADPASMATSVTAHDARMTQRNALPLMHALMRYLLQQSRREVFLFALKQQSVASRCAY